jgi:hypothetical protein
MKQGKSRKRILNWVLLGLSLLALSGAVYFVHYLVFGDPHHIFIYLVGDIAFVPVEVLLVTLIIHRLLSMREKRALLNKLNMVVGTFFSDVGNPLIRRFAELDPGAELASKKLDVKGRWAESEFEAVRGFLAGYGYGVDSTRGDLEWLKGFLAEKKDFLLRLLENPNLLEHDSFTDLLWAVFHLAEELGHRHNLAALGTGDREHLEGDISRAYRLLASEWVGYMQYMKKDYPYLFSLAVRTNPFNPEARAEVS